MADIGDITEIYTHHDMPGWLVLACPHCNTQVFAVFEVAPSDGREKYYTLGPCLHQVPALRVSFRDRSIIWGEQQ